MRRNIAGTSLTRKKCANLKRRGILAFDAMVRYHCIIASDQLGDDIREEHTGAERYVILHNAGLTAFLNHNEVAWMHHRGRVIWQGHEDERNRLLEHSSFREIHERTIRKERCIQGRKRVAVDLHIPAKVRLD